VAEAILKLNGGLGGGWPFQKKEKKIYYYIIIIKKKKFNIF
jgi:hypothetical protein